MRETNKGLLSQTEGEDQQLRVVPQVRAESEELSNINEQAGSSGINTESGATADSNIIPVSNQKPKGVKNNI